MNRFLLALSIFVAVSVCPVLAQKSDSTITSKPAGTKGADTRDSTIIPNPLATKEAEVSVVVFPSLEVRLTILCVGLVILGGFGLLLNAKRSRVDAETRSEAGTRPT